MNSTLRSICNLLKAGDTERQTAAAIVLAEIRPRDPGVSRALGEALTAAVDPDVAQPLLYALQRNPHEQAIKHLLDVVGSHSVDQDMLLETIAGVGPKVVAPLKKIYPKAPQHARHAIAEVVPRIRSEAAIAFMMELLQGDDVEVVRRAIHALRDSIAEYNKKERGHLLQKLRQALSDKKVTENDTTTCGLLIALGVLSEPKSKPIFLEFVTTEHDDQVRRYALLGLAELEYGNEGNSDVIKALKSVLEDGDEALVRHAVDVLRRLRTRRSDAEWLRGLLHEAPSCVQAYALQALGQLNTVTHTRIILPFLHHKDHNLRDAAREALAHMSAATDVLVEELHQQKTVEDAEILISILTSHSRRLNKDRIQPMVKALYELLEGNDNRHLVYREALLRLSPDSLKDSVLNRVRAARKRKDFAQVRDCLRLLRDTPFMNGDIQFQLAMAKLKTSRKELGRTFRQGDYCLTLIGDMLHSEGKPFVRTFLKESTLDLEDYFYVGFHFSERLNEERRFGADVLRHVAKKGKRSKIAKAAREKLRIEGH